MNDKLDKIILDRMLPGHAYKVSEIAELAEVALRTARVAMERLESRARVLANRTKRCALYRLAEGNAPVVAPHVDLLSRAPYRQDGAIWDLRREQIAAFRGIKSRY